IEGAALADVAELRVLDVVRRAVDVLGDLADLIRRHVDELGARVDEAADQPGTRDAIDLRMLARDPFVFHRAALSPRRQARVFPAGNAAFEIAGLNSCLAQSGGRALAHLVSMHAIGYDRTAIVLWLTSHVLGSNVECANDQPVVG